MNKKIIILAIIIIILTFGLSGCIEEKTKFIGTWRTNLGIMIYTFNEDGTYQGTATSGTYEIKDGRLICASGSFIRMYEYEFMNDDNTLILNGLGGAASYTLTKQVD